MQNLLVWLDHALSVALAPPAGTKSIIATCAVGTSIRPRRRSRVRWSRVRPCPYRFILDMAPSMNEFPAPRRRVEPEDICSPEWAEWYRMTPAERWAESEKLWAVFLELGGSLDPEPDTQSPFFDANEPRADPADGRPGLRIIRRSGV